MVKYPRNNDTEMNSDDSNNSTHNDRTMTRRLDQADRFAPSGGQPRSLLRDRPLSRPVRHRPTSIVVMNGSNHGNNAQQQQSPSMPPPPPPPPPPAISPKGRKSPPILPKIRESTDNDSDSIYSEYDDDLKGCSGHDIRKRDYYSNYRTRLNDNSNHSFGSYGNFSSHSISKTSRSSRVPSLCATASDVDSVDSFILDFDSQHSLDTTGSDSTLDCDLDNDCFASDNNMTTVVGNPATLKREQQLEKMKKLPRPLIYRSSSSSSGSGNGRRRPLATKRFPPARSISASSSTSSPASSDRPLTTTTKVLSSPSMSQYKQLSSSCHSLRSAVSMPAFRTRPGISAAKSGPARPSPKRKSSTMSATEASASSTPSKPSCIEQHTSIGMTRRRCLAHFLMSGFMIQLLLLFGIVGMVLQSRSQAALATDTLLRLRETESLGLLKLHRLEDHSIHVHELVQQRLLRHTESDDDETGDAAAANDPLSVQYEQLTNMSSELKKHAAVQTLQETIQHTASLEIVETYGEGPVKVVVELDFGDLPSNAGGDNLHPRDMAKGTYISIVLWADAPHAAWTWLEQIQRSIWDGATVGWDATSTLFQIMPIKEDPFDRGHLEFVEFHSEEEEANPDMHHGAWTIGLRETVVVDSSSNSSKDDSTKKLEMFINLANNKEQRKHETCVGKIVGGFDAIQRLLEATLLTKDGDAVTNVTVKSVTAMHMTHQELEHLRQ